MKKGGGRESVSQKSAAEFFSEHQQIAGFDNPGKSLFTSIRELVENSLDAAESIHVLPEIELSIIEYTETEHNARHGISTGKSKGSSSSSSSSSSKGEGASQGDDEVEVMDLEEGTAAEGSTKPSKKPASKKASTSSAGGVEKEQMYFQITCKDNGCGIPAENVGDMLGRVLSGSKHGVRQTRGKFGLGAKMALIWSKKSSGLPISVKTAHASSAHSTPSSIAEIVLDIDIYKNTPKILSRHLTSNGAGWRGTEISVTIAGNWSVYRSRVLQYFQQLAVITPYANFVIDFQCSRDAKKSFRAEFQRRSEQMPPIATEVLPHPRSLNNITLSNLLRETSSPNISKFLTKDLCGISTSVAGKIAESINVKDALPNSLSTSKIAALCQVLRDEKLIKPPVATCLSPAGEYNIRLGVLKELRPQLVATFTDKAGSHEGHPFLVEAAVSIGGKHVREGINVYRFANRIPLLFETGADVVTQVATKRINWSSYHIDPKRDSIGVYVSVVSTRIPFKGTSKEYIGDDVLEMQYSVKRAITGCCQQLKVNLARSMARKEDQERKKTLVKYIPDISKSLIVVLQKMQQASNSSSSSPSSSSSSHKRSRMLRDLAEGVISEESLASNLHQAVARLEADSALQAAAEDPSGGGGKRSKLFLGMSHALEHAFETKPTYTFSSSSSSSSSSSISYIMLDGDDDEPTATSQASIQEPQRKEGSWLAIAPGAMIFVDGL